MSGVGVCQPPTLPVNHGIEEGNKFSGANVVCRQVVDVGARGRLTVVAASLDNRRRDCHTPTLAEAAGIPEGSPGGAPER